MTHHSSLVYKLSYIGLLQGWNFPHNLMKVLFNTSQNVALLYCTILRILSICYTILFSEIWYLELVCSWSLEKRSLQEDLSFWVKCKCTVYTPHGRMTSPWPSTLMEYTIQLDQSHRSLHLINTLEIFNLSVDTNFPRLCLANVSMFPGMLVLGKWEIIKLYKSQHYHVNSQHLSYFLHCKCYPGS